MSCIQRIYKREVYNSSPLLFLFTHLQMGLNFCAGTPAMASMASSSRLWLSFTVNLPNWRSAGGQGDGRGGVQDPGGGVGVRRVGERWRREVRCEGDTSG